jgi:hypothetical protein
MKDTKSAQFKCNWGSWVLVAKSGRHWSDWQQKGGHGQASGLWEGKGVRFHGTVQAPHHHQLRQSGFSMRMEATSYELEEIHEVLARPVPSRLGLRH